jgi:hypothetical protein
MNEGIEMNEGTPLGAEYIKPMAVVLKGPTVELYLFLPFTNNKNSKTLGCD